MKKITYILVIIIFTMVITAPGCKKESNDENNVTKEQFVGTWQGILTFAATSESFTEQTTLTILQSGENLSGYLIINNDPEIQRRYLARSRSGTPPPNATNLKTCT